MKRSSIATLIATYLITAGVVITAAMQIYVHKLDTATATQCQQHDWPVNAHEVHMAWCAANNYATN